MSVGMMKQNIAVKFRAYPTNDQANLIDRTIGCARLVYNLMLATRIEAYKQSKQTVQPTPAQYKKDHPFLREVDSMALCNAQMNLNKAYKNFFANPQNTGFPKFKAKHHSKLAYTTNLINGNIRLDSNVRRIKLPKIGWLAIRQHKTIPHEWKLKSVTVEHCKSGKFTLTILFEYETQIPEQVQPVNVLGIDYASYGLYVSSDGEHADYPGYYRKMEPKLQREQHKLSCMIRGSKNWVEQKQRIARIYEKIAHQRHDFLNKITTRLANQYDMIAVEDIDMTVMARKPKPKPDPNHPSQYLPNGATSKTGLAKSTMDNGFGMFRTMLSYKMEQQGKQLVRISKWYPSSQLCNVCEYKNPMVKDLSIREWDCPNCHTHHNRDENAARNLKKEALQLAANKH